MFKRKGKSLKKNGVAIDSFVSGHVRPGLFQRERQEYAQLKKYLKILKRILEDKLKTDRVVEKTYERLKRYYNRKGKILFKLNFCELNMFLKCLKSADSKDCEKLAAIIEIQSKQSSPE
ncbi:MAG TPA: hypothetical protein ENN38_03895 [Actinobacteria bacterium]|nr:hypothetical protein [Actinomycetota bacterium]